MKNLEPKKLLTLLTVLMLTLTSCWKDKVEENLDLTDTKTQEQEKEEKPKDNKFDLETENEVYNEIADENTWLKEATNEDIDKILQEELRLLNTPTSKYLFFEQNSNKTTTIEEVKKSWWLEVTRWIVYLQWQNKDYKFIYDLLNEWEKDYSFFQDNWWQTFFYLDGELKEFLENFEEKIWKYKEEFKDENFQELSFEKGEKEYRLFITEPSENQIDNLSKILQTEEKVKVEIIEFQ